MYNVLPVQWETFFSLNKVEEMEKMHASTCNAYARPGRIICFCFVCCEDFIRDVLSNHLPIPSHTHSLLIRARTIFTVKMDPSSSDNQKYWKDGNISDKHIVKYNKQPYACAHQDNAKLPSGSWLHRTSHHPYHPTATLQNLKLPRNTNET